MFALDAAGNPDPGAVKGSGAAFVARYVGTAHQAYGVTRDYVAACHAIGLPVALILEEWGSQFLGGYDAAVQACGRMMAGWDDLGAPRDGTVLPMVALVDPSPGAVNGNEGALRGFARGWDDALRANGFREWTGYGSRYGLDLAGEVAPGMTRRWGVGTWGYGERPDGGLPADVGADMIQHGNRAAPVPGCDYNTLLRPDMGQWAPPGPRAATGDDLVAAAATFLGQPYSTAPGRDDPASGHKDCSGLVAAAYQVATGDTLGANVSVTIYDLAVRHGLAISYEQAVGTAGACILKPDDPYAGWGAAGHIALSDGSGGTVEATPPRVQRLPLSYNAPWSPLACLLPGINYGRQPPRTWSDDMIYVGTEHGKTVAFAMQGNIISAEFTEPATNPYGIPDDAVKYADGVIPIRYVPELLIAKLRTADRLAMRA